MVKLLLDQDADVEAQRFETEDNGERNLSKDQKTILMHACMFGRTDVVELLLDDDDGRRKPADMYKKNECT